jgi:REP element-mobilizing transposase RayT
MPYWRMFYHIVWTTKHRAPLITPDLEGIAGSFKARRR